MDRIYSCLEDYDMAIDDFILAYETFPIIDADEEHICSYCKEKSAYGLRKTEDVEEHPSTMV